MKKTTIGAVAVSLTLLLAACGDDNGGGIAETGDVETSTTAAGGGEAVTTSSSTTEATGAAIALDSTSLGDILVDADGKTLYAFGPDSADKSTCNDACATTWPPLMAAGGESVGNGLDSSLISTITRDDGSKQLAYGDHPLYTYAGDTAAGQTNGQGVGGRWHVVDADGVPVQG